MTPTRRGDCNFSRVKDTPLHSHTRHTGNFPRSSEADSPSSDVQSDFRQIRERFSRVDIPQSHKLNADRTGVKRDDQVKFNVLASCAKYSETVLKIVATASQERLDHELVLSSIYTVALAQQKYIQDEYASLLVSSSFDAPTARFFKQLQRNTTTFTPEALGHLQAAATIAAAHQPHSHSDNNPPRQRSSGFRYNSRRGRFRGQLNGDVYSRFTNTSQFPNSRPNDDHA